MPSWKEQKEHQELQVILSSLSPLLSPSLLIHKIYKYINFLADDVNSFIKSAHEIHKNWTPGM